jgi:hypothetical protein
MATAGRTTKLDDDFTVSAIGFGARALAAYGDVDDAESLATLNRCPDLGVTFIDTVVVYGGGGNERLIAKLPADRRDEVTLATKFGMVGSPANRAAGRPPVRGDAAYVRRCIDESLARLQTDVVDLYYMHQRDLTVPIEEAVGAMADAVRSVADEQLAMPAQVGLAWLRYRARGPSRGLGTHSRHPAGVTRRGEPRLVVGHPDPRPLTALDAAGAALAGNRALTMVSAGREWQAAQLHQGEDAARERKLLTGNPGLSKGVI